MRAVWTFEQAEAIGTATRVLYQDAGRGVHARLQGLGSCTTMMPEGKPGCVQLYNGKVIVDIERKSLLFQSTTVLG